VLIIKNLKVMAELSGSKVFLITFFSAFTAAIVGAMADKLIDFAIHRMGHHEDKKQ
jgi:hypothetical protein